MAVPARSLVAAHHSLRRISPTPHLHLPSVRQALYATPRPSFPAQRPASTQSVARRKPASPPPLPTTTTTTTKSPDRLNPPATLSAPDLTLPARNPSSSRLKHYYTVGKTYLKFYKAGASHVWTNYKLSQSLLSRLAAHRPPLSRAAAARTGLLSRAEHQLLLRSSHDVRRVPIFALVFIVCGEWTPLIVPFMSGLVPGPCRTPAQDEGDLKKLEGRRKEGFRAGEGVDLSGELRVEALSRAQALHVGRSLGVLANGWERVGLAGLMDGVGLLRRRVGKRVEAILLDDELIRRGGGVRGLQVGEVRRAASGRGIDVLGPGEGELRRLLGRWVDGTAAAGGAEKVAVVLKRVLTRPSVWDDVKGKA